MNRSFVFTRAVLAVIGLLLVGPQKASAQTISACVNSATGLLYVVAANANCPPSSGNVTWTKTTLSTTPGVLAGAAYQCANQIFPAGGALVFVPSLSDINFGSQHLGNVTMEQFPVATGYLSNPFLWSVCDFSK
jgi:hypothetical protein